ncbi:MAG: hypothetical protein RBT63_01665 [Bdellovibrionales bacterium]|jgi:P pilus assembly chaperone PapD|nr:hypothetical protein [Bdellovibrionales bacterium]
MRLVGVFITLLLFVTAVPVEAAAESEEAFYIEPMEFRFSPGESRQAQVFRVHNRNEQPAKVRVEIFLRSEDMHKGERRALSSDIRPDTRHFLLPAGESRDVSLTYHGSRHLKSERAYRVVVTQEGVAPETSLDMRFVYVASAYVTPRGAESKVRVVAIERESAERVKVRLFNSGTAHKKLHEVKAELEETHDGRVRTLLLGDENLRRLARENVLAGSYLTLDLDIETKAGAELRFRLAP